MGATSEVDVERARIARRALLKKAAVAGAVAWTAPVVLESVTNPAGALTCAPGNYYVVYQGALAERTPLSVGCTQTGTNVTAASIGLTASFNTGTCTSSDDVATGSIAHIASADGNCFSVTLSVAGGCPCTITSVYAHVHNRSAGTCPQTGSPSNYCWAAGATIARPGPNPQVLRILSGNVGTNTVTVQPNFTNVTNTVCVDDDGVHWGSPNAAGGYLVVNVTCTS